MSQNMLNMDPLMEKLHCPICNGYLSCGPVRVLPDGSCICGQCSPPSNDSPIYRVQALEAILENVSFPCRFAQHGCSERFLFGQTAEHELECEYRSFACPSQNTACCWEGSTSKMLEHFTETHPEGVVENVDLKLQVDLNSGGVILVPKESVLFAIKYRYKADNNHLTYDIRICKNDLVRGASYKLQLITDSDPECTINLKAVNCLIYDDTFYGVQNAVVFNLNKYLEVLNNLSCILINVNLTIHHNIIQKELILDSLRCYNCQHYIVPPLFYLDDNIICCDCSKANENYLPHSDTELLQLLKETDFPCRWRNCKFITKNNNLKRHELKCQFRQYNCFLSDCYDSFTLTSAPNHYKMHKNYEYRDKELSFTTLFAKCHGIRRIFSVIKRTIIALRYLVTIIKDIKNIQFNLYLSDAGLRTAGAGRTTGSIHFEHQHCNVKSQLFEINNELEITLDQLPPCFTEKDKLMGILII